MAEHPDATDELQRSAAGYGDRLRAVMESVLGAVPEDPRMMAEGIRYVGRLANLAHLMYVEFGDTGHPSLFRFGDDTTPYGATNTDNNYYRAMVDPAGTYRIHGNVAGVRELLVSVHEGEMALGRPEVVSEVSLEDLELDEHGGLELFVGGPELQRNWLAMNDRAAHVTVREFVADWENDPLAVLHVERVDALARRAPIAVHTLAAALDAAATWVERSVGFWREYSEGLRDLAPHNELTEPRRPEGAAVNMLHGGGIWDLEEDQALIVELDPPRARYWSVQGYMLEWMQPLDFANSVTSLNDSQVHVDGDGRVRIVVARRDPGVQNWLDTTGLADGLLSYRYVRADSAPRPRVQVVPASEVRSDLPPDTPRWGPAERAAQIASRRRGIDRRFRR